MRDETSGRRTALTIVAVVAFLLFAALYLRFTSIPDSDSYFHLALARLCAQEGFVKSLDWTRFSVFATTLGDKEVLFHLFLMPFSTLLPGEVGGRIALAIISAAIATLLARAGLAACGRWGLLLPLVAFVGSPFFYGRVIRLRPELFGLIIIVIALELLARRKRAALAVASAAFALTYVVSHLLTALVVMVCAWWWIRGRERDWKSPLASLGGTLVGIVVHPHFPDNLEIWRIVNVTFFSMKSRLDVGREIGGPSLQGALLLNAGVWLAIAVLAFATIRDEDAAPDETRRRIGESFAIAAIFFFVLFTQMERMITYVVPLTLVAVTSLLRAHGRDLSAIRLGKLRVPVAVALVVCSLAGLPRVLDFTRRASSNPTAESSWRHISAMLPPGARVAAHWGPTGFLVFFAPQARYLNVLEPLLMYEVAPDIWRTQQRMFTGWEPDIPLLASTTLDSEFVFAPLEHLEGGAAAARRFAGDPRMLTFASDGLALAKIVPGRNGSFALDWTSETGTRYPRLAGRGALLEGFVDAARVGARDRCVTFEHRFESGRAPASLTLDFAPYGPGEISLDGQSLSRSSGTRAFLSDSIRVSAALTPGEHSIGVRSCPDTHAGINGFYLVDRGPAAR